MTQMPPAFTRNSLAPGTPTPTLLWATGFLATLIFAFSNIYFKDASKIAEPLLALLGFWCVFRYGSGLARGTAFKFLWAALIIQCLSWASSHISHPHLAESYPKLDRLARLFLFLLIAWWLGGKKHQVFIFWIAAAAGLLLSPWMLGFGYDELARGVEGRRIDLDIRNAQHTAVLYGIALIGLLVFLPRVVRAGRIWVTLPWVGLIGLTLAVILFTQTRAVWSGLFIVAASTLVILFAAHRSKNRTQSPTRFIVLLLAAFCIGGYLIYTFGAQRLQAESDTIQQVLNGDFENMEYSSVGTRIHSWRAALEFTAEHPILGWGGNARQYVLAETDWVPDEAAERFHHLHNSYLELLTQYGIVGLLWYLLLIAWLAKSTWRAWRTGDMPSDTALFFGLFLVFWSWVNLFESYLGFWTGEFAFNVVVAGALTHIWKTHFRQLEARS